MVRELEMRWLHSNGDCADDFESDSIVLIKHASSPDVYFPLTLQHREIWTDATGSCATAWTDVAIIKGDE